MADSRTRKLARYVLRHCLDVKPNQNIIVSAGSEAEEFVVALFKETILAGANPLLRMYPKGTDYFYFKHANKKQLQNFPHYWYYAIKKADAFIHVESKFNTRELSSIKPEKVNIREKTLKKIKEYVFWRGKVKNVIVAYPCLAHAIEADMSLDEWKDFVFNACLINWEKLSKKYNKIAKKFNRGEEVHLIGDNVDLKFLIKDKNALLENGRENVPGGEIYMSPVKKSLNGWIKFGFSSNYEGKEIRDIFLRFKNGKIVEFDASKNKKTLKKALELDKNASYIGEFGIGINPKISKYSNIDLFDEKMNGTVHLALGSAYVENGGGNDSAIHWDLVKDMKKAEIILDGKTVQKNGKWKI